MQGSDAVEWQLRCREPALRHAALQHGAQRPRVNMLSGRRCSRKRLIEAISEGLCKPSRLSHVSRRLAWGGLQCCDSQYPSHRCGTRNRPIRSFKPLEVVSERELRHLQSVSCRLYLTPSLMSKSCFLPRQATLTPTSCMAFEIFRPSSETHPPQCQRQVLPRVIH